MFDAHDGLLGEYSGIGHPAWELAAEPWFGYKILVFAGIVFCSLMINRTIGPYVVGIRRIAEGTINEAENAAMTASLKRAKMAVVGIWIGLVIEVILGVTKPGSAAAAMAPLLNPL